MERGRGGGREGGEGKEKRRGSGLHGRYKKKGERGRCGERRRERGWGGIEEKREVGVGKEEEIEVGVGLIDEAAHLFKDEGGEGHLLGELF